jgi:hypothetical protein
MTHNRVIVILAMVLIAPFAAQAAILLSANLTHSQETVQGALVTSTGDPRPLSFGFASFVLNDAQTALTFTATIFNIDVTGTQTLNDTNDNLLAAHIHAPAPPGVNANVQWGFFGMPDNDVNPDDIVVMPFMNGVGGVFTSKWDQPEGNGGTTLAAQLPSILAGLSYINFHTGQFGGGEIRGQINVVPEPSAIALTSLGLVGLLAIRRRRK